MEDVGILYGHAVYFTAIRTILLPFELFHGRLVYFWGNLLPFHHFGILYRKYLATL
jgi:hypothetical protein